MVSDPVCPACGGRAWRRFGSFTYRRADLGDGGPPLSAYQRLRLRVLFEVWAPDAVEVVLCVVMCQRCGFVCYAPRPTEAELEAKYRFLAAEAGAGAGAGTEAEIAADRERAARTFGAVVAHSGGGAGRVLDYGGAEGRLLGPFVEAGWSCAIVDYVEQVLPGVERLGATLDDVPAGERFDAILCSHVVEHLAEPGQVLQRLAGHLAPGGVLFVEVPVDLWRAPPIERDPVTHVNFLTALSLEQLMTRNGVRVHERGDLYDSYARVRKEVAVAIGSRGDVDPPPAAAAVREVERRFRPTPAMCARRVVRRVRQASRRG